MMAAVVLEEGAATMSPGSTTAPASAINVLNFGLWNCIMD
jgi:hypothetical protein